MPDQTYDFDLTVSGTLTLKDAPTPPPQGWPNCPPGLPKLTEWDCSGELAWTADGAGYVDEPVPGSDGWRCIYNHTPGTLHPDDPAWGPWAGTPYGWAQERQDPKAPFSPKPVAEFTYAKGMRYGIGPCTIYKAWGYGPNIRELYAGYWFRYSPNFDTGPVGCKQIFFFNGGGGQGGQLFTGMGPDRLTVVLPEYLPVDDPDHPYYVRRPNVNVTQVTLDEWHRMELYVNLDTHQIKWWLDDLLQGDYADLVEQPFAFDMFQISSTYGGNGDVYCAEDQTLTYDHVYLAGKAGAGAGADAGAGARMAQAPQVATPQDWATPEVMVMPKAGEGPA